MILIIKKNILFITCGLFNSTFEGSPGQFEEWALLFFWIADGCGKTYLYTITCLTACFSICMLLTLHAFPKGVRKQKYTACNFLLIYKNIEQTWIGIALKIKIATRQWILFYFDTSVPKLTTKYLKATLNLKASNNKLTDWLLPGNIKQCSSN